VRYIKLFEEINNKLYENLDIPTDYLEFVDMLKNYGIETDLYGTGTFKTIGHLYQEIEEGETTLSLEDGKLVRKVEFVGARILYKKEGDWFRVYEDKQVFVDGRIRRRSNMPYSAAEKFKSGEDPKEVIVRGMKEELDLDITKDQFTFYNRKDIENNDDYPGIRSFHIGHEFLVILNENQYNPEGYIERQKDKDVYFVWRPMSKIIKESKLYDLLSTK